jgi:hypothetical protein
LLNVLVVEVLVEQVVQVELILAIIHQCVALVVAAALEQLFLLALF